jgi:hypothetical protein
MYELTPEQRQELDQPEPVYAVDPETKKTYVLVAVEHYERIKPCFISNPTSYRDNS